MASALIAGAALGAPFSEALSFMIDQAKEVKSYNQLLADFIDRLDTILIFAKGMYRTQGPNSCSTAMFKFLERGEKIVIKSCKVKRYQLWKRAFLARKIKIINAEITMFSTTELQMYFHQAHMKSEEETRRLIQQLAR